MAEKITHPKDGPWRTIIETDDLRSFYPRSPNKLPRSEFTLPSGAILIDDFHKGYIVRDEYCLKFDWEKLKALGRRLKDRGIMKRQSGGERWFRLTFQEVYDETDALKESRLRLVEEYKGKDLLVKKEFP